MKKNIVNLLLFICLMHCNVSQILAMQYYVNSRDGNDLNSGTRASTPWKSLARVNSMVFKPGDIVNFSCGSKWNSELSISSSGMPDNPIIFRPYGQGDKPLISNPYPAKFAIIITGKWLIIDGFIARDAHMAGIELAKGADHNVVQNCEVTNTGMGISSRGSYNLITRNYVHNLYMIRNTPQSVNKDDDYGAVAFWMWAPNNEISYNKAVNCEQPSYDYELDGGFVELYTNGDSTYIHHNWAERCNGFLEVSGRAVNVTLAYNVSVECSDIFIFLHMRLDNSGNSNVKNLRVDNNTVIRQYGRSRVFLVNFGNVFTPPPPGTLIMRNNIFVLGGGGETIHKVAPTGDFIHENNIYYLLDKAEIGYPLESKELVADPKFEKAGTNTFKLSKNSPARRNGISLGYSNNFTGKKLSIDRKVNIGAY